MVTGAGRGVGRAIALSCARTGAVIVCSAPNQAEIDEMVAVGRGLQGSDERLLVVRAAPNLGIGFSHAIGRPKNGPEKAPGRARRGPKYASLGGFSAQSGRPGFWRLGAGELAGL